MTVWTDRRRIRQLFNPDRRLVKSFSPPGRSHNVIYVVSLAEHPGIVKIGRTHQWSTRRMAYANWNLSKGNAIAHELVFVLCEEFVDLAALEKAILQACPFQVAHGYEWFNADFEECSRYVEQFLVKTGLSFDW